MTAVIFKICTNTALISDMQVATTVSGLTTVSEKIHSSSSLCVNQFNQSINQSVSVPSQNPDIGGSHDVCIYSMFQSTDYIK